MEIVHDKPHSIKGVQMQVCDMLHIEYETLGMKSGICGSHVV